MKDLMTYTNFLIVFLGIPILLAAAAARADARAGRKLPAALNNLPAWMPLALHVFLAVAYTTPWDNYLVATGVWYYNPRLVTGITLGWVPLEEYTFFIVQTILSVLWLYFLAKRVAPVGEFQPNRLLRLNTTVVLGLAWVASLALLSSGWKPGTYLALILVWSLPPIMLQMAFGADILWHNRRLILTALLSVSAYLGLADSLAISAGTWTIDPRQSFNVFLGNTLPIEELLFFFTTNALIIFGVILNLAAESRLRLNPLRELKGLRGANRPREGRLM
jgi:lycopene cyclase domain-containing protein